MWCLRPRSAVRCPATVYVHHTLIVSMRRAPARARVGHEQHGWAARFYSALALVAGPAQLSA
eukprot:14487730-Alexandrium_andersonii.AAC.1